MQKIETMQNDKVINYSNKLDISIATKVVWAIKQNQLTDAITALRELTDSLFPKAWIKSTEYALKTGDWLTLSDAFIKGEFIGQDGYFLLIAPYQLESKGGKFIKLSALLGQQKLLDNVPTERVEEQIWNIFGVMYQPLPVFIPFICLCAAGHHGFETSEALILPELWMIPDSVNGPVLSNLTQHRHRFYRSVKKNIRRIFEPSTAKLLLESLTDEEIGVERQSREYWYHEASHATGLGIRHKVRNNLLLTNWYSGIEEWRTDGVEFELAVRTLPNEEIGKLVAANLCLRFGVDAQRTTNSDLDTHAICSLLMLDCFLRSGVFCIQDNQLALCNPNNENLAKTVEMHRTEAILLTREEIAVESIDCYQLIKVEQEIREIFQKFVIKPCL